MSNLVTREIPFQLQHQTLVPAPKSLARNYANFYCLHTHQLSDCRHSLMPGTLVQGHVYIGFTTSHLGHKHRLLYSTFYKRNAGYYFPPKKDTSFRSSCSKIDEMDSLLLTCAFLLASMRRRENAKFVNFLVPWPDERARRNFITPLWNVGQVRKDGRTCIDWFSHRVYLLSVY